MKSLTQALKIAALLAIAVPLLYIASVVFALTH
jgi:hypothetical protein